MPTKHKEQFLLNMSENLAAKLENMSEETHSSKSDVIRKALTLLDLAIDSRKHGKKLAIVSNDGKEINEILGV